jgi:ABC-type uncharacterized transport system YnjBCD ATPase subunit
VTQIKLDVKTAALTNVTIGLEAAEVATGRREHLPGMVTFTGYSGLGKSATAAYVAQKYSAYLVAVRRIWTRKAFLDAILFRMGIPFDKLDMPQKLSLICEQLACSGRPLIIDEFDNIVDRPRPQEYIELVRDIADGSQGSIIIIGEERLPHKLSKYERFHNRILAWYQAVPADMDDCRILSRFYYPDLEIGEDLLAAIHASTRGVTRRVCVNLAAVAREAADRGISRMGLHEWGSRSFYTGEPPKARSL